MAAAPIAGPVAAVVAMLPVAGCGVVARRGWRPLRPQRRLLRPTRKQRWCIAPTT